MSSSAPGITDGSEVEETETEDEELVTDSSSGVGVALIVTFCGVLFCPSFKNFDMPNIAPIPAARITRIRIIPISKSWRSLFFTRTLSSRLPQREHRLAVSGFCSPQYGHLINFQSLQFFLSQSALKTRTSFRNLSKFSLVQSCVPSRISDPSAAITP